MTIKIAIIGGGPAGIFCAIMLNELISSKISIDIFEKDYLLKTILPTGGGRCNLSYAEFDNIYLAKNYPRGEKFLYSIFKKFTVKDTLAFFKKIGIETYTQEDKRIFPKSNSSKDVREKMIKKLMSFKNVRVIKKEVKNLKEFDNYNKIIISTGSRCNLAKSTGHNIIPFAKSLHGYITKEKFPKGVSLTTAYGAILFTHQGVSGPFIYRHSSINAYAPYPRKISIPLLEIDKLKEEIIKNPKKSIGNIASLFIPKSLSHTILDDYNKQGGQVSKKELENLEFLEITATGADNKGEIVHAGGVNLKEINQNCQSKFNNKLYFIGEVLDVDGFCGGFNLQNCWSSAACAAFDIADSN